MKKVITYGTFDLLHQGHINLLKRAKALGDYLIVGVTTDSFDYNRGKLNVCNNVMERIESVRKTGLADQIIIEEYTGQKIDDIQKYGVDIFAIGSDWEGKFDYLNEFCKVVYLPRTEGISSTMLREESQQVIRIGIIGTGSIAQRFVNESQFVNGVDISIVYNPIGDEAATFARHNGIALSTTDFESLFSHIDACYVASPHLTHFSYCKSLLERGVHVLNETPFVLKEEEAEQLYALAERHHLVLMDAIKTAYCPAFRHLVTLIKSGIVGSVIDIEASLSMLTESGRKLEASMAGGSMSEDGDTVLLPILTLLGIDYNDIRFYSLYDKGVDMFTKAVIAYKDATATIKVGLGVKTEGSMVISGTKGYVYVPSPWWKTDYFEVRYEDQNKNKKYFYSFDGDGLRYELQEFVSNILNEVKTSHRVERDVTITMARIQQMFHDSVNAYQITKK
jgi:glycerol-3-phosphate cytidylyltransferase